MSWPGPFAASSLARPVCRDRDNDAVLATALAGYAEIILAGDEGPADAGRGHARG